MAKHLKLVDHTADGHAKPVAERHCAICDRQLSDADAAFRIYKLRRYWHAGLFALSLVVYVGLWAIAIGALFYSIDSPFRALATAALMVYLLGMLFRYLGLLGPDVWVHRTEGGHPRNVR